ncbi:MAG: N-acetyl sugar amidotransferase [Synergistaceae bacterium]|nr:N-acetyl sugar amidotransferase [Synergistaceae bacterium]
MLLDPNINEAGIKICSRCIYDERVDGISFDSDGVCNYCHQVDMLKEQYGTGQHKGELLFSEIVEQIKKDGKNKPYDCIVGVSGGTDSSYMLYLAKERGLRPLAVHYNNTWNTEIANQNIKKIIKELDVELSLYSVEAEEADDIFRSFFLAGVPEIEGATDLAMAEVLYRVAAKYGIKYTLDGHSFETEGISPLGRNYFDGKYIKSIHSMYGAVRMKTYPLMTFSRFMRWTLIEKIKRIRPHWYLQYTKENAQQFLKDNFGWEYYGGHHLENRMTVFFHSIYAPQKFGADFRNNTLSALARMGKISREEAWKRYNTPPVIEDGLLDYFKKRLKLTDEEYLNKMNEPPRSWREFPTYKKRFELLRPLFKVLAKNNLVPMSFYLKYCF